MGAGFGGGDARDGSGALKVSRIGAMVGGTRLARGGGDGGGGAGGGRRATGGVAGGATGASAARSRTTSRITSCGLAVGFVGAGFGVVERSGGTPAAGLGLRAASCAVRRASDSWN
jgi:hypothetical protein